MIGQARCDQQDLASTAPSPNQYRQDSGKCARLQNSNKIFWRDFWTEGGSGDVVHLLIKLMLVLQSHILELSVMRSSNYTNLSLVYIKQDKSLFSTE